MLSQRDLKAPKGKFRVIGVDTFDGTDWIEKDCITKDEALKWLRKKVAGCLKHTSTTIKETT
jgi:hypothetical protein